MISVLVSTHGSMAKSLIETTEMICGKQAQCEAVSFTMGQSLDVFKQEIKKKLDVLISASPEILCLVDLKGGTPFNTLVNLMADYPNLEIITGVNIPMLLTALIQRSDADLRVLLPDVVQAANHGIEWYNMASITNEQQYDEDF